MDQWEESVERKERTIGKVHLVEGRERGTMTEWKKEQSDTFQEL